MDNTTKRRRSRGSAWYWKQTDCWYYTAPGTRQRVRLAGLDGMPIRGAEQRPDAELAMARARVSGKYSAQTPVDSSGPWVVARVCSEYIIHCERRHSRRAISLEYLQEVRRYLNAFSAYCGAVPVAELKKAHLEYWLACQTVWRSTATQRNAVTMVLAAFNHAEQTWDVRDPLRGYLKPPQCPRLHAISPEDETAIYQAAEPSFKDFIFAAIHTGLRPFCELARLTSAMVVDTPQGMLWRVHSSKTKKLRVIPVRSDVAKRTRLLMASAGSGPIFRNRQGNIWKKPTAGGYLREIRRSLGWEADAARSRYTCYSCRHTFAHRMLSGYWNGGAGCTVEVLAELLGDTPKVAYDHYGREWAHSYQDPLWKAIGVD